MGGYHPLQFESWKLFVSRIVAAMGTDVQIYAPQNEPNANALAGYIGAVFPPGAFANFNLFRKSLQEAVRSYRAAADIIHEAQPNAKVLSIQNIVYWTKAWWDIGEFWFKQAQEYNFFHLDAVKEHTDILGFNYYTREEASPFAALEYESRIGESFTDMGWNIDPEGLYIMIKEIHQRYQKPMVITENGIADKTDIKRRLFLKNHLASINKAKIEGLPVIGYFHWSMIDNFEWAHGYEPQFGLFKMNAETLALEPKLSAYDYKTVISGSN